MFPLYIRLHSGNALFSKGVKFVTWDDVSHVSGHIFNSGYEFREKIGWNRFDPFNPSFSKDVKYVYRLMLNAEDAVGIEQWWMDRKGAKYDYLQVLRFLFRKAESKATQSKYFCSEAWQAALLSHGIDALPNCPPYKTRPCDFKHMHKLIAKDVTNEYLRIYAHPGKNKS